jgi:hypothetical protein
MDKTRPTYTPGIAKGAFWNKTTATNEKIVMKLATILVDL